MATTLKRLDNLDGFILSGEKINEDDWRRPTIGFGFFEFKPRITMMSNREEPIGVEEWRKNITNYELNTNGAGIFIEAFISILEKGDDGFFTATLTEQKFEDGVYIKGETVSVGSLTVGIEKGIAFIRGANTVHNIMFKFGNPFRVAFKNPDNTSFSKSKISILDALGKFKAIRNTIPIMQVKYSERKEKLRLERGNK